MMKRTLLVVATMVALSASAQAVELIPQSFGAPGAPPPPSTQIVLPEAADWSGLYVGVTGGYGGGTSVHSNPSSGDIGVTGWVIGAGGTYNFQFDNDVVLGIDANFDWTDVKGSKGTINTKLDWDGVVGAHLGYAIDKFMPFASVGLAVAGVHGSDTTAGYDASEIQLGLSAGAGLQYQFTNNFALSAQYRYLNFSGDHVIGPDAPVKIGVQSNQVLLGALFKF